MEEVKEGGREGGMKGRGKREGGRDGGRKKSLMLSECTSPFCTSTR